MPTKQNKIKLILILCVLLVLVSGCDREYRERLNENSKQAQISIDKCNEIDGCGKYKCLSEIHRFYVAKSFYEQQYTNCLLEELIELNKNASKTK